MSILTILLQDVALTDSTKMAADMAAEKITQVTYLNVFFKGGWVSWAIIGLSVFSLAIIGERIWIIFRLTGKKPNDIFIRTQQILLERGLPEAQDMVSKTKSSYATILKAGLNMAGRIHHSYLKDRIDEVAQNELAKMEKRMGYIALVAGAAPMVGFLGTVMGMITAFAELANQEGATSAKVLAEGIYQAMGTTMGGLIVGLISYIAYNYLATKIHKISGRMNMLIHEFVVMMQSSAK